MFIWRYKGTSSLPPFIVDTSVEHNGYCILVCHPLSTVTEQGVVTECNLIADCIPNKATADWICSLLNKAKNKGSWTRGPRR